MRAMLRAYVGTALIAICIHALPEPATAQTELASIPVFAQLATEPELRSYVAPVDVTATIHKLFFTFNVRRHGTARFESPDTLTVSLDSVPPRYTGIFGELGDVRMWPLIYDLEPLGDAAGGPGEYAVRGVPRNVSDVDHVLIRSDDAGSPIAATWYLHGGWTITAIIETRLVEQCLLPERETADIAGHGMKIHAVLTFGDYALNESTPAPVASLSDDPSAAAKP